MIDYTYILHNPNRKNPSNYLLCTGSAFIASLYFDEIVGPKNLPRLAQKGRFSNCVKSADQLNEWNHISLIISEKTKFKQLFDYIGGNLTDYWQMSIIPYNNNYDIVEWNVKMRVKNNDDAMQLKLVF